MLFRTRSYAGAGLVGNPSDGSFGKTIALTFTEFAAEVTIYETPELQLCPADVDDATFTDIADLVGDTRHYGYYGGLRLLKAATKVFVEHCAHVGIELPPRNFTARYSSTIPRLSGLGDSSAVCTAMLKALVRFYDAQIPVELLPTLCWRAEHDELGIPCGFQDRVAQIYDGVVFMDLDRSLFDQAGHGRYEPLDPPALPPLFIAFSPPSPAGTSVAYHRRLHVLVEEQQQDMVKAMSEFADIAEQARTALAAGDPRRLAELINANFDLRRHTFPIDETTIRRVERVRALGASAKLAGGSGAIIGTCGDESAFAGVAAVLEQEGCTVVKPTVSTPALPARCPTGSRT